MLWETTVVYVIEHYATALKNLYNVQNEKLYRV